MASLPSGALKMSLMRLDAMWAFLPCRWAMCEATTIILQPSALVPLPLGHLSAANLAALGSSLRCAQLLLLTA